TPSIPYRVVRCRAIDTSTQAHIHPLSTSLGSISSQPCTKGKTEYWPASDQWKSGNRGQEPLCYGRFGYDADRASCNPQPTFVIDPVCKPSIDASGRIAIAGKKTQKGRSSRVLAQRGK